MSAPEVMLPSFASISLSRRALLRTIAITPLTLCLAACGGDKSQEPLPSIPLDSIPQGTGRGFPLGSLLGADNSATGINKGDIAPNFRMQFADDSGLYLSDLVGKPILINFWATWCGPCRLEMPEIVQRANDTHDLIVLAINVQESEDAVSAFAEDFQMTMPVVRDVDGNIRYQYDVRGMPTSVFIDRDGKISTYREGVMSPSMLQDLLNPIL